MKSFRTLLIAVAISAIGTVAIAQTRDAPLEGRSVLGAGDVVLGVVERVVLDTRGRVAQVLVRPKGKKPAGPHSLDFAALEDTPQGLVTPLTKAEFDAMPAVDLESAER